MKNLDVSTFTLDEDELSDIDNRLEDIYTAMNFLSGEGYENLQVSFICTIRGE